MTARGCARSSRPDAARRLSIVALGNLASLAALAVATPAHAQRTAENAMASADDAFGSSVGLETTGIYSENDTRGFSPLKAGNARNDGVYYDPVATTTLRLRAGNAIRVGYAALDYPFPAPTGIVDSRLRSAGERLLVSPSVTFANYGGFFKEVDVQVPVVANRLSVAAGIAATTAQFVDGARSRNLGVAIKPVVRFAGLEISPFYSFLHMRGSLARPLVVVGGAFVPAIPRKRVYLGQPWAKGASDNDNSGVVVKAALNDRLSLRAGGFRSAIERRANYTEQFTVVAPSGLANHRLVADPNQDVRSTSGEAQLAWRLGKGQAQHRLLLGYRARHRVTETGGSDVRNFGQVILGEQDVETEPRFVFGAVNRGTIDQSAVMLGYLGSIGRARINLGLQKADYRARFRDAAGTTRSSTAPWLYNASLAVDLSPAVAVYAGTVRGLEDSGAAPENAANRNEQLPAARTMQYDAGVRWKVPAGQLVVSAFEITKPYFSFEAANRFDRLGNVRHRGLEASFAGKLADGRVTVLAGALLMDPVVSGPGRIAGLVGRRPAGTPSLTGRLDLSWRTPLLSGLTATGSLIHSGERAAGSRPLTALGGAQLMLPAHTVVDLGLRHRFKLGTVPATFRFLVANVLDAKAWKVIASNVLQPDDRRRASLAIAADF